METEQDTLKALIEYLLAHGYPESSIAIEWPIGKYRADLAVVDPDTREPIAIFELKQRRTPQREKFGRMQLSSFLSALGKANVPSYLVFGREGSPPFEIQRVSFEKEENEDQKRTLLPKDILDFNVLRKSRYNALVAEKKTERKKYFDWFWFICWVIAAGLLVLFYLDLKKQVTLSNSQLTLMGATIALILIPFASKLKILGIEFERLMKREKSE